MPWRKTGADAPDVKPRALAGQSGIAQDYGVKSMAPSEELGAH